MASGTIPYVPTVPVWHTSIPAGGSVTLTFDGNARAFLLFSSRNGHSNGIATVAVGATGSAVTAVVAGADGVTLTPSGYDVTIASANATDIIVLGAMPR